MLTWFGRQNQTTQWMIETVINQAERISKLSDRIHELEERERSSQVFVPTFRDYLAGQILAGVMTTTNGIQSVGDDHLYQSMEQVYRIADIAVNVRDGVKYEVRYAS